MVEIGERPLMGMEFLYGGDESIPQLIVVVVANPVNMLETTKLYTAIDGLRYGIKDGVVTVGGNSIPQKLRALSLYALNSELHSM